METHTQYFLPQLLSHVNRLVQDQLKDAVAAEELQTDQWTVLVALSDSNGHAMGDLAESATMNPSKLTKTIDKMVSKGLVQRSADIGDHRKVVAFITDLGLTVVNRLHPKIANMEKALLAQLGKADHQQLTRLLVKMLAEDSKGGPESNRLSMSHR